MDGRGALELAKECAAAGLVRFTLHARERMDERGALPRDVVNAICTAKRAGQGNQEGRWVLRGGVDEEGEDLAVVVAFEGDVLVITLF